MKVITVSGPKSSESQARNALARARFSVTRRTVRDDNYGFAAPPGEPISFVRCEGDDIDRAVVGI